MALELHVSGPGLDVDRRLQAGEPALILGRDSDCAVCLPDPERNISRRHLSVWNEGDQLHFHVLSVVNGVATSAGELPPGARGILPPGEDLVLSAFRVHVSPVAGAPGDDPDPWATFARQAEQLGAAPDTAPMPSDDDVFGEWGFTSTFGPGSAGGALRADALAPAVDLAPFLGALGIQPPPQGWTQGELEMIGRLARVAVQGLLQLAQVAAETRKENRADDRTTAAPRELNPLRLDTPDATKLYYLFGGHAAAAGFLPPERALAQLVGELSVHQQAMSEALRDTVRKVVEDFDPESLKKRLLGGGPRIFESARAWDAFARDYAQRSGAQAAWVQSLLDRHFARAYAQAMVRAKRNTSGGSPP